MLLHYETYVYILLHLYCCSEIIPIIKTVKDTGTLNTNPHWSCPISGLILFQVLFIRNWIIKLVTLLVKLIVWWSLHSIVPDFCGSTKINLLRPSSMSPLLYILFFLSVILSISSSSKADFYYNPIWSYCFILAVLILPKILIFQAFPCFCVL